MFTVEFRVGILWSTYPERFANAPTAHYWARIAWSQPGVEDVRILDETTGQAIKVNTLAVLGGK